MGWEYVHHHFEAQRTLVLTCQGVSGSCASDSGLQATTAPGDPGA